MKSDARYAPKFAFLQPMLNTCTWNQRQIFDNSRYLSYLQRSNISLTDDPITNLLPNSIRTKSGMEYPADVIVSGMRITSVNLQLYTGLNLTSIKFRFLLRGFLWRSTIWKSLVETAVHEPNTGMTLVIRRPTSQLQCQAFRISSSSWGPTPARVTHRRSRLKSKLIQISKSNKMTNTIV